LVMHLSLFLVGTESSLNANSGLDEALESTVGGTCIIVTLE